MVTPKSGIESKGTDRNKDHTWWCRVCLGESSTCFPCRASSYSREAGKQWIRHCLEKCEAASTTLILHFRRQGGKKLGCKSLLEPRADTLQLCSRVGKGAAQGPLPNNNASNVDQRIQQHSAASKQASMGQRIQ
eukprot:1143499-Pelagomonas_calceolata.AAC.7